MNYCKTNINMSNLNLINKSQRLTIENSLSHNLRFIEEVETPEDPNGGRFERIERHGFHPSEDNRLCRDMFILINLERSY